MLSPNLHPADQSQSPIVECISNKVIIQPTFNHWKWPITILLRHYYQIKCIKMSFSLLYAAWFSRQVQAPPRTDQVWTGRSVELVNERLYIFEAELVKSLDSQLTCVHNKPRVLGLGMGGFIGMWYLAS